MKLASGFCIPEPLPVHTGIKGRQVHPLIRFTLRSRDESLATSDGSKLWHGDITSPFPPSGTEAWPRGQRWMVHYAGAGCAGSPRFAALPPENCWAKPSTVVAEQPSLGDGGRRESVPCRRPSSLPGWARDGAPGPPWWTSPSRGTAPWLSSLVERSQSPCAAPHQPRGRYYPRAPVWAPWLGDLPG